MTLSIGLNYNSKGLASQRFGPLDAKGNILNQTVWDSSLTYALQSATKADLTDNLFGIFPGVEVTGTSTSSRCGIDQDINWLAANSYDVTVLYKKGTTDAFRAIIFQNTPRHNISCVINSDNSNNTFYDAGAEPDGTIAFVSDVEIDAVSGARLLNYTFTPWADFTQPFQAGPNGTGTAIVYGAVVKIV